jgi:uncharacterized membrane protein YphA (DoxX/SURF4 family)
MRGGTVLQRIFSAFPSGSPGAGLLILRASLGVTLVAHGGASLWGWHNLGSLSWVAGIVAIASGLALVIGYLTPLASVLAGLTIIGTMLSWFGLHFSPVFDSRVAMDLATSMAVALVCLGPGAFSIDARLFGRREIIIPGVSSRSKS